MISTNQAIQKLKHRQYTVRCKHKAYNFKARWNELFKTIKIARKGRVFYKKIWFWVKTSYAPSPYGPQRIPSRYTVLLPYREQNLPPKIPKCSLYGRSARIGNKDFLKSRKIRSYYIKGPKTPICTIVIVFSSLSVISDPLKFQKLKLTQTSLK